MKLLENPLSPLKKSELKQKNYPFKLKSYIEETSIILPPIQNK